MWADVECRIDPTGFQQRGQVCDDSANSVQEAATDSTDETRKICAGNRHRLPVHEHLRRNFFAQKSTGFRERADKLIRT